LIIESASEIYLYDYDGKQYIDFSTQVMNVNIGHGNSDGIAAITKQLNSVAYVSPAMVTKVRGELGETLAEISPGSLTKTFFTNGGADAIESAIWLARTVTGKYKIISKYRSYHGATYGAMSAGGDPRKRHIDRDGMANVVHVEDPLLLSLSLGERRILMQPRVCFACGACYSV